MHRGILPKVVFTALMAVFARTGHPQGSVPPTSETDSVLAAANRDLPTFLGMVPPGQEARYGFEDRAQFASARIGTPIPVFTVRASVGDSLAELSDTRWDKPEATGTWRVPVRVGGRVRSLLTVERMGGAWQGVEIGAATLARELEGWDTLHPHLRKGLLRLDKLRGDVLLLDSSRGDFAEARCQPLHSFRLALPEDSTKVRSRKEMFRTLHKAIRMREAANPSAQMSTKEPR